MGKPSRDKGARGERDLVHKLRDAGLDAKRVPLSGACDGFKGDVVISGMVHRYGTLDDEVDIIDLCDGPITIECKVRARGFKFLYDNIDGSDVLAVRSDRNEWLVVERLSDWVKRL